MLSNKILLLFFYGYDMKRILQELMKDPELKSVSDIESEKVSESFNYNFTTIIDQDYPTKLRTVNNPPCVLFYNGDINLLNESNISITGSKFPTTYGLFATCDIVKNLAQDVIITNLSYGIDKQVIISAIENNKKVVCLLSNCFENPYPDKLKELLNLIVHKGGLVLSIFKPNTAATPQTFIQRNEILAALCDCMLVVESEEDGECMHIVDYVVEMNKDVYALPGTIYSEKSKGTNMLIQDGAQIYVL